MKFNFKLNKLISSTKSITLGAFFIISFLIFFPAQKCFPYTGFERSLLADFPKSLSSINSEKQLLLTDSLKKKSVQKPVFVMKKSPWKAVAYSAILPGAGQFYNQSYWKIPVIAGLGGYFVYEWIKNNNEYLDYKQQYINSQTPTDPSGNPQLQYLREFYRDQRDNFIVYSIILYVVNLIDAYVDAQLFDFDVSDKVKLGLLRKEKLFNVSFQF